MRLKTLRVACVAVLVLASACSPQPTAAPQSAAAPGVLDRTVLPIHEPAAPTYKELDARNAKAPPPFAVNAPDGAPSVVIVLIDDLGFDASSAFGGPIRMPTLDRLAAAGQWDAVWPDGDIWKAGLTSQAI